MNRLMLLSWDLLLEMMKMTGLLNLLMMIN